MNRKCLMANAFALSGRGWEYAIPGVPLRSAPGYVLAAFSRRPRSLCQEHIFMSEKDYVCMSNRGIYVLIILKKTHFVFCEIEKLECHSYFFYACFIHGQLAVRASRRSHEGRFALQGGLFRNVITALLQCETALSAFLIKPCQRNALIISVSHLKQKSRFWVSWRKNAIL